MKKNRSKIFALLSLLLLVGFIAFNLVSPEKYLSNNQQIVVIILLLGLLLISVSKCSNIQKLFFVGLVLSLSSVLMWNYLFNNIGIINNNDFVDFQNDSEAFVANVLIVQDKELENDSAFGLCYYDVNNDNVYPYVSQVGLQGKVFSFGYSLVKSIMGDVSPGLIIEIYHTLVAFITAVVFSLVVIFIKRKVNIVMSICFYLTFLLSPWVVNFARNLYWLEFTWFVPLLIGIVCSINVHNKKIRIISYVLAFLSILIKSLCGYEYLSTIMMASISFLLVDLIKSIIGKDKKNTKVLFKTVLIIGICEVLGFIVAILLHSSIRGDGSILMGLSTIYKEDVLRRTFGGNVNNFDKSISDSLNASTWTVILKYFKFHTNIVGFIPKEFFMPLVVIALIIGVYEIKNKKHDYILLFIINLLTSLSWIVLAKSHSYEHTHISFIVWYFGFIQICFYIITSKVIDLIKNK